MHKLQQDRENCIGCGACEAVAPDFFEMKDDGKSQIKGAKKIKELWERDFDEKDFETIKEAADSCPVNVIHIIKDGKKII
jgi:ferredoxin